VAEKRAADLQKQVEAARAAFAAPVTIGAHTFYPPNSQTLDAFCQPAIMALANARSLVVMAYLLTIPPARQIAAAGDVVALRNQAAEWQDSIDPSTWDQVADIAMRAHRWIEARLTGDTRSFFFRT